MYCECVKYCKDCTQRIYCVPIFGIFIQNLHALGEDSKEVDRPQGKDPAPKTGNTSHNRLDADEDPCWICKIKKDLNIVSILAT